MPDSGEELRPLPLTFLRNDLIRDAVLSLVLAVVCTAIVTTVFGWDLGGTLLAAAGGAIVFGLIHYPLDRVKQLPSGQVPRPPESAFIERRLLGDDIRRLLLLSAVFVPLLLGLAWFVDLADEGGFFLPGFYFGDALAALAAAGVASRWEDRHQMRLMVAEDDEGEKSLYADSPLARPELSTVAGLAPRGPIHPS